MTKSFSLRGIKQNSTVCRCLFRLNFFTGEGWACLDADHFDVKMVRIILRDLSDAHLNRELIKVKLDQLRGNAAVPASTGGYTAKS